MAIQKKLLPFGGIKLFLCPVSRKFFPGEGDEYPKSDGYYHSTSHHKRRRAKVDDKREPQEQYHQQNDGGQTCKASTHNFSFV